MLIGNGAGFAMIAAGIGFFLALSYLLAFHETLRGAREMFDLRAVRNFLRSMRTWRPRYSLATLLAVTTIAPPLIWVLSDFHFWHDPVVVAILLGYVAIVVCPALYWFYVEAFGQGPRQRWRDVLERGRKLDLRVTGPDAESSCEDENR